MMSIKDARHLARMSQNDVCKELEIPRRTLQSWESGERELPEYMHKLIVDRILERVKYAEIRWESEPIETVRASMAHGFSCWVIDPGEPEKGLQFYWYVECSNNGKVSAQVVWKIQRLLDLGYHIEFIK